MLFLISLVLAFAFAFICGRPLKRYPYAFYGAAAVITVITVLLDRADISGVTSYIAGLFTRGAFAAGLWCVVMWTGALPNGSAPIKKLMPIRGELSIFAAILTLGHNIGFGHTYFALLFRDTGRMPSYQTAAAILSLIMMAVMLPLTVMSFPQVRRKMNARLWKKIQRTAYLFYAMLYVHVMLLSCPMAKAGRQGYLFSIIIYSIVFIGYAVFRVRKWYIMRKKPDNTRISAACCIALTAALTVIAAFCSRAEDTASYTLPAETVEETTVSEEKIESVNMYRDGTYTASAYGYDGEVSVTVTVENGVITEITGSTEESDSWYYDKASGQIIPEIISSQGTDVDAYSGATYSSDAIISAVRKALDQAEG